MNMPLQSLKLAHLQNALDMYRHQSRSSIMLLHKCLHGAFEIAIKNEIINKNYAKLVTLPPMNKSDIHKPFTDEEYQILWQHTDRLTVRVLLVYLYTGLRPVELRLMTPQNIHLKERYMTGGVKTKAGRNRIIPIAECITHS